MFQQKYTNLPASQYCSDLRKETLQELAYFHWESSKENQLGAAARNKSSLALSIWPLWIMYEEPPSLNRLIRDFIGA